MINSQISYFLVGNTNGRLGKTFKILYFAVKKTNGSLGTAVKFVFPYKKQMTVCFVDIRCRFNVDTTSYDNVRCRGDVETTSCVYEVGTHILYFSVKNEWPFGYTHYFVLSKCLCKRLFLKINIYLHVGYNFNVQFLKYLFHDFS